VIRIAVTKGRIEKSVCKLLKACGFDVEPIENKGRELLIKTKDDIEMIFAKSNDVLTFIEHGIVDLGIVGKDTLDESDFTNYNELLDLEVGKCYFALAAYPEYKEKEFKERKKIATKYPNVAKKYFANRASVWRDLLIQRFPKGIIPFGRGSGRQSPPEEVL